MTLRIKRIYDDPSAEDGVRILVDRLWPRGISKEQAKIDRWMKEIAPSDELRKKFHRDPSRWPEFKKLYFEELDANAEAVKELRRHSREGPVTLLYAAKDPERNNAVALREYLTTAKKRPRR